MSEFLTIAIHAEGSTDYRFLKPIIQRTVEDIILNCDKDIEIYPIIEIHKSKTTYIKDIENASRNAYQSGIKCLVLHCDSDNRSSQHVISNKINPAISHIKKHQDKKQMCLNIIPLIPIHMSEAWMLSDIELLKQEIGADSIDNSSLGLTRNAERYADPKAIIEEAIKIAQETMTRRHRKFKIADLYTPLGQKIELKKLKLLTSYVSFYNNLKDICLPYCR